MHCNKILMLSRELINKFYTKNFLYKDFFIQKNDKNREIIKNNTQNVLFFTSKLTRNGG